MSAETPVTRAMQQSGTQDAATQAEIRARVREAVDRAREAQQRAQDAQQEAREAARAQGVPVPPPPSRIVVQDGRVIVDDGGGARAVVVGGGSGVGPGGATIAQVGPGPMGPEIPAQAVDITYAFFFTVAVIAIGIPLVRAFARWLDRRGATPAAIPADLTQRLDRIEGAVEAMATEVERIAEGQRFTSKLMAELRQLPQLESPARVAEPRR